MRTLRLAAMLIREWTSPARLERRQEPDVLMDECSHVDAFHAQGALALIPIYHFNALATSCLTPEGGSVVDLGSGSGQYLAYLARCRPDLRIIGVELAPTMVEVGRQLLAREGLSDRVELRVGDMTDFSAMVPDRVDLVSSVFSLHHLPNVSAVAACLAQVRQLHEKTGCALWIFDHARPRHPATPESFPAIFTPSAAPAFNRDSSNSLVAAWSFSELLSLLGDAGLPGGEHGLSRWLTLYQIHWLGRAAAPAGHHDHWHAPAMTAAAAKDFKGLRRLFPHVPAST